MAGEQARAGGGQVNSSARNLAWYLGAGACLLAALWTLDLAPGSDRPVLAAEGEGLGPQPVVVADVAPTTNGVYLCTARRVIDGDTIEA